MNNNYDEKYSELRNGLKEFMKNCDHALSANEIKDIISKICPEIRNEIEKETAQEICDFIEENHTRDSYYDRWISWIRKHADDVSEERIVCKDSLGDVPNEHTQIHNGHKQKLADKIEPIENKDVELTDFESALFTAFSYAWQQYLRGEEVNVAQWAKEHSSELLEAARQKPAEWSEEDELQMRGIIDLLPGLTIRHNWLKSLKDRIQPQPKQEWSEKDKEMIFKICQNLYDYPRVKSPFDRESFNEAEKEVQFIKSLRPQNHLKPSEEQINALSDVLSIRLIKYDVLSELLKCLKKLK